MTQPALPNLPLPAPAAKVVQLRTDLLTGSYRYYARTVLKIKTDEGIVPFNFNQFQDYLDFRAIDMLKRTGKIRFILIKARQQGGSEYISGRGFKFATQNLAKTVYILSHETKSTGILFDKVDRYYKYADPSLVPEELASNKNQKKWANDSEYSVGTAGSETTGRGYTVQFLHLSEASRYSSYQEIQSGLVESVSDKPLTEIWYETTANGMNWLHEFVMNAIAGLNEFEVIFTPWFWSDKYAAPVKPGFARTEEENELAKLGTWFNKKTELIEPRPLTDEQLQWRRTKVGKLGERLFKQEYPSFLEEAFQASGNSFIPSEPVQKAMHSTLEENFGADILGVDPAHSGDRFVMTHRKGRQIKSVTIIETDKEELTDVKLAHIVSKKIDEENIDKCNVDIGAGYGLVERLKINGYGDIVEGISFAEGPDEEQYLNKRAEMFFAVRDWFRDNEEIRIPNNPDIATDIAAIPDAEQTDTGRWKFPSKKDIKKNYGKSPDIFDSIALTFARKVRPKDTYNTASRYTTNTKAGDSELSTRARINRGEGETSRPLQEKRELRRSGRDAY